MDNNLDKIYQEHLAELRKRMRACTNDELGVIAEVIAEIEPDILFNALSKELKERKRIINKFKSAIEREEA